MKYHIPADLLDRQTQASVWKKFYGLISVENIYRLILNYILCEEVKKSMLYKIRQTSSYIFYNTQG